MNMKQSQNRSQHLINQRLSISGIKKSEFCFIRNSKENESVLSEKFELDIIKEDRV